MKVFSVVVAAFFLLLTVITARAATNPMTASCASTSNKTTVTFSCCTLPDTKKTKQLIVWLGPYGDKIPCSELKNSFVSSTVCNLNTTQVYLFGGEPDEYTSLRDYAEKNSTNCTVTF